MTRLYPLLLALILLPAAMAQADSGGSGAAPAVRPLTESEPSPAPMVRILRLSGIGPDGREQRLFDDATGFEAPIRELGRIGERVDAAGLADGSYHTLFVELADDYRLPQADGSYLSRRLSEDGQPRRLRVSGMIQVENGQATALRMLHETSYYAHVRRANGDGEGEGDDD